MIAMWSTMTASNHPNLIVPTAFYSNIITFGSMASSHEVCVREGAWEQRGSTLRVQRVTWQGLISEQRPLRKEQVLCCEEIQGVHGKQPRHRLRSTAPPVYSLQALLRLIFSSQNPKPLSCSIVFIVPDVHTGSIEVNQ